MFVISVDINHPFKCFSEAFGSRGPFFQLSPTIGGPKQCLTEITLCSNAMSPADVKKDHEIKT